MNMKRLTMSLLLISTTGFAGVAMGSSGGGSGSRGSYPATPSAAQNAAPSMMTHPANGGMGMDGCPMMNNAHLSGKVSMQMHAEMMQAMSDITRKYADKADAPTN